MKIQNRKILVPGYLTNQIYPLLLKKSADNALFGVKTDNVYSLMDEDDHIKRSHESIIFEVYDTLKENRDSFAIFRDILGNIAFIEQFISFYTECVYYEIDMDALPEESDEEKEIKKIVSLIDRMDTGIRENYESLKNKLKDCEVIDDFYSQFLEHKLLHKAIDNGCKRYDCSDLFVKETNVICKKATTRGKELDDIASFILANSDRSVQVICPRNIYLEDTARVFDAYRIPYRRISYRSPSLIVMRIREFVDFLRKKDTDTLVRVLRHEDVNKDLCDYLEHFGADIKELSGPFGRFRDIDHEAIRELERKISEEKDYSKRNRYYEEKKRLLESCKLLDIIDWSKSGPLVTLEEKAEKRRLEISDTLDEWLNGDPYDALLKYYNCLAADTDWKAYDSELSAFSDAGRLIKESRRYNGDLGLLNGLLKGIKTGDEKGRSDAVVIGDTDHMLPGKDITIVIGANEGVFLPVLEMKGIVKEDYVSRIDRYPTLGERLQFNMLKMECLKHISKTVVISYCYSDYAGKEHKLSSYIENTFGVRESDFIERDTEEFSYHKNIDHTLSKDNAKELFVRKDNGISGSVSSLEKYQSCPYRYFLERGIGISELEGYQGIDPAVLGTLRHKIFEILGHDDFRDEGRLDELLDEYMGILKSVFTGEKDELELKRRMMGTILGFNEQIARELRNSDDMSCAQQEYRLDRERVEAGDHHFNFTAIVDRIDTDHDRYRVIDYKSGGVSFSAKNFLEGRQLQLLTYLWLLWKKDVIKKEALGAFYFNLDLVKDYRDRTKDIIEAFDDSKKEYETFRDKNRLQGWYVPDSDTRKKQGLNNPLINGARKVSDSEWDMNSMEGIDEFLNELFRDVADNIVGGNMETRPDTDTCRYCSFASICHKEEFETAEEEGGSDGEE